MRMDRNQFLAGLAAGEPQIGIWSSLSTSFAIEVVADAGFDWVLLDMEYSPNDLNSVIGTGPKL